MFILLDAFCGSGGAAMGYAQALEELNIPFRILGFDKEAQPEYPFEFYRGDAVLGLYKYAHKCTFIHASPPCQAFSHSTAKFRKMGTQYPNFVPSTRHLMNASGKPGIIENVMAAPIGKDLVLRGDQFGLKVIRARKFEMVNLFYLWPRITGHVSGSVLDGDFISVFGKGGYRKSKSQRPGWRPKFHQGSILDDWRFAMDMPWVNTYHGLAEAIPPAYTKFIGLNLFPTL